MRQRYSEWEKDQEIERLRQRVAELEGELIKVTVSAESYDGYLKDAERYRLLRRHHVRVLIDGSDSSSFQIIDCENAEELDVAIDAAMEADK